MEKTRNPSRGVLPWEEALMKAFQMKGSAERGGEGGERRRRRRGGREEEERERRTEE